MNLDNYTKVTDQKALRVLEERKSLTKSNEAQYKTLLNKIFKLKKWVEKKFITREIIPFIS